MISRAISLLKGISIVLLTLFFSIVAIFSFLINPSGRVFDNIARLWAKFILMISRVLVLSSGKENVRGKGPYIFVSNHQSLFDTPVLFKETPLPFRIVAKRSLFHIPIFGWVLKLAGFISIDRERRERAIKSLDTAIEKAERGMSILVFGEGTRSYDGNLLPFKKGGFVMAIKSGLPVIPITIYGTHRIMKKGTNIINGGKVRINYGEPIETRGLGVENKDILMNRVREVISRNLERFENEER